MSALTGTQIKITYGDILQTSNSGAGVSASLTAVADGLGTATPLKLSSTQVGIDNLLFDANSITTSTGNISLGSTGGTTTFGDTTFTISNPSAFRTGLGLGTIATQAANNVTITGGSVSGITDITVADGGTGASDATTARSNLGLVIGTNVQAYDTELAAFAGLTSAADKIGYFNGSGTMTTTDFTSTGRTIVNCASTSAVRTALTLVPGTDIQAYDAELAALASTTSAADKVPYFTGAGTATTTDLTSAARTVLDDTTTNAMLTTLGGSIYTGSGGLVRETSATLVTPLLGTPTSGTLTNCTGYTDANLSTSDITTNNSTSSKHGFLPKLSNNSAQYLNGQGSWATPAGAGDALTTNPLSQFASTTSSQLAGVLSDEVGTGKVLYGSDWANYTPTVTLTGGAGNTVPVYSTNLGRWCRIGNLVHVTIALYGDGGAEGAGTGRITIALPVAVSASAALDGGSGLYPCGHFSNGTTEEQLFTSTGPSATTLNLFLISALFASAQFTGADQNNTTRAIHINWWYEA